MISVDEALAHLFALVSPLEEEVVALDAAASRVMIRSAKAKRDQPPFPASAMDGYAISDHEVHPGAQFSVIGEAAAGHAFEGHIGPGQATRIFTGAPVPEGADRVVIQEDVDREGDRITLKDSLDPKSYVRRQGSDFAIGDMLAAPRRLGPSDIALLASMNIPQVTVSRRPIVALISTGDELVLPGDTPGPDQIIASNTFGLKAMLDAAGAHARILPIARDTRPSLEQAFKLARGADLVVTIGGASVGDHDLVGAVAASLGMEQSFYKIRMRPGKPLMAGKMGDVPMVGLPGNPVSAMVCGQVFLIPMIRAMLGFPAEPTPRLSAPLAVDMPEGGPREHYMRANIDDKGLTPAERQDSSLLNVLAKSNALMVRPVADRPRERGEVMEYLPL